MSADAGFAARPLGGRFSDHLAATAALALPIAVARIGVILMFVADAVMTGWAGEAELASLGLGSAVIMALVLVAIGALQSVAVLSARALGRGARAEIGPIYRAGLLLAAALGLLILALSAIAEPFFLLTGQTPDLARSAGRIAFLFALGVPGILFFSATTFLLEATGAPRVGVWIMAGANLLNVGLNALLIFGADGVVAPMGAAGAVVASNIVRWVAFLAALAVLWRRERKGALAVGAFRPGGTVAMLRPLAALGLPMGLAQGLESTGFAAVTVISGRIGIDAAAVHQAMMSLLSFIYMFSVGVSGAVAIRVGQAAGGGDRAALRPAGLAGLALSLGWTLPFALLFLAAPEAVGRLFGLEGATLQLGAATILVAAVVVPFDGMMAALIGALRGLADVWVPTLIQGAAFWVLAVPVAAVFAPNLDAPGLMLAILSGVVASFVLMALRFRARTATQ